MEIRSSLPVVDGHSSQLGEAVDEIRRRNLREACCVLFERAYDRQATMSEF